MPQRSPSRFLCVGFGCVGLSTTLLTCAASGGSGLAAHDLNSFVGYAITAGEKAYSAGATWCNLSESVLAWEATTDQHPISVLNLYRVEGGVMVQLGASWATHQYCALQLNGCGTCEPAGSGCPPALGVGCSTNSTGSALGSQPNMSKRSEVDAASASFPFPFANEPVSSALDRRCRVKVEDVDPALHPNAVYFFELITLHPSEGELQLRCVSRKVKTSSLLGTPIADGAALEATSAADMYAMFFGDAAGYLTDVPNDGRIISVCRWDKLPSGSWRYTYVIENINSSEGVMRLAIPIDEAITPSDMSFHAPLSHSGEVLSNDPWTVELAPRELAWSTEPFDQNANANAIRWGTTYTFSFVSPRGPTYGSIGVKLFKSGETISVPIIVPHPATTAADADFNHDGHVDAADLAQLLGAWGSIDDPASTEDLNANGNVDSADLAILLGYWTN